MIRQYLPQTNESATVAKSKKISHLNKALITCRVGTLKSILATVDQFPADRMTIPQISDSSTRILSPLDRNPIVTMIIAYILC